jgi:uncharacterized protein YkwD
MRLMLLCALAYAGSGVDERALVEAHNRLRAKHCAPPLEWSKKIAASAQKWAGHLHQICALQHSGGQYGENLAAGTSGMLDENRVVSMWYDESKHYNYKSGGFSMKTGHFTQVVWKETRALGCAKTSCNGLDVWVCQYDPPGNVEGFYRGNVAAPTCAGTPSK